VEARIKLNNYIKSLAEKKIISVTQLDWTKQYDLELYDYLIELQIGEFKTTGRGTSKNETEAIQIAFSEAVERLIIKEHGIANSSGCAVHLDREQSIINSRNELIERDCFLCYFYLGSNLKNHLVKEKNGLTLFFEKLGITYRNYLLYSSDIYISLNVIFDKSGLIFGLGVNNNKSQSIYKAMIESIRQYIHIIHFGNKQTMSVEEFRLKEDHSFNDHGNLLFDHKYLSKIFTKFREKIVLKYHYPQDGFISTQYGSTALPDLPLIFTRTNNKNLQSLYLGAPHNNINMKRLSEFNIPQKDSLNNNLPHPLR
jgi:hypothetical protein